MKKMPNRIFAATLALILCLTAAVLALSSCAPTDEISIAFRDDVDTGRLEFVTGAYDKTKPTLLYFHGLTESDEKIDLVRPAEYDAVLDEGESKPGVTLKSNLADYWKEQDWNLAIFHFEKEASEGKDKFFETLFKEGGLLEEFINVYRLFFKDQAGAFETGKASENAPGIKELRFAGEGIGADFAAYAAEVTARLYREGRFSEFYLPARLTLLNPDLDNAAFSEETAARGAGASPLQGVARAVKTAAVSGYTAGELIESDMNYSSSYQTPYTEEDQAVYDALLQEVACLEINETFSKSAEWSDSLTETVARVWYLATIGGSDYASASDSTTPSTMKGLYPFINNPKENYSNSVSFSVSAWTPTAAIRLLRGLRFRSAEYNSSNTPKHTERVITKFRLELFESSFLTQNLPRVGGYLFVDKNGDGYFNDGRTSTIGSGVAVRMRYTISGQSEKTVTAETDCDGFYMFEIPEEAFGSAVYIDFVTPDYRYLFGVKNTSATADESCSLSSVNGNNNYVSSSWKNQYGIVKNCGYKLAERV